MCEKIFTNSTNLLKHRSMDTKEKPYPCVMCNKLFAQKSNLMKRRRIETEKKSHLCDFCGKSFALTKSLAEINNLMAHRHRRESHPCEECNKLLFSNNSNLMIH